MPVPLRTPLCDELGIDVPILSAGMGSVAGVDLVAAVSEAGGFGVLGVSGVSPDVVRTRIDSTRVLTKRPFGVNVIIDEIGWAASDEDRELVRAEVASAIDEQVAAVVLFWGDPAPFVELAHGKGVTTSSRSVRSPRLQPRLRRASTRSSSRVSKRAGTFGARARSGTSSRRSSPPSRRFRCSHRAGSATAPALPGRSAWAHKVSRWARASWRATSPGLTPSTRGESSRATRTTPSTRRTSTTSHGPGPRPVRFAIGPSTNGMPQGRPPPGHRPGEGTTIGTLRLLSGETVDVPRYAGAGSPVVGFEGDLGYPAMWAGESVEVVNDVLPAGEIVRMLMHDAAVALG